MALRAFMKLVVFAAITATSVSASASATPNAPYLNEYGTLQTGVTDLLNITANAGTNSEHTIASRMRATSRSSFKMRICLRATS
jgi:hypothetical protein